MTPVWSDLGARARGLGTRLIDRPTLERLVDAPDLVHLGDLLRAAGVVADIAVRRGRVEILERELRRRAGHLMRALTLWAGTRGRFLTILIEDEDRRSVRTIVRGTLQGVPAAVKTAGLVPTNLLPERALETLAARDAVAQIAALLAAWRHPYAPALDAIAADARPDLFVFERAVDHIFHGRVRREAQRAGRQVRAFVADMIDLDNAFAALVLTRRGGDVEPDTLFFTGGRHLSREDFVAAVSSADPLEAEGVLRRALDGSVFQPVFDSDTEGPHGKEGRALHFLLERYRDLARLDPVGPAPVLRFVLRLRAEAIDLRRVIAGVTIGAPPPDIARELVSLS